MYPYCEYDHNEDPVNRAPSEAMYITTRKRYVNGYHWYNNVELSPTINCPRCRDIFNGISQDLYNIPETSYDNLPYEPLLVIEELREVVEQPTAADDSTLRPLIAEQPVSHRKPVVSPTLREAAIKSEPKPGEIPGVFGKDLTVTFKRSGGKVPLVVLKCLEQIENWGNKNKSKALTVYYFHGVESEINEIKASIERGDYSEIDVDKHDVHTICGVLKKYLVELPDPVIPVDFYNLICKRGEPWLIEELPRDLLYSTPVSHKLTLDRILTHITRLAFFRHESGLTTDEKIMTENMRINNLEFQKIVTLFTNILIRPQWEDLLWMFLNWQAACNCVYHILTAHDWSDLLPPFSLPACPDKDIYDVLGPLRNEDRKLLEAEWFWGTRSQDFVSSKLRHQEDGSFMVWNSDCSKDYILSLKCGGREMKMRIIRGEKYYGFAKPLDFPSVVSLISWYRTNSLKKYNSVLNTTLTHPIRNPKVPETISEDLAVETWYYTVSCRICALKEPLLNHLVILESWLTYTGMIYRTIYVVAKEMLATTKELQVGYMQDPDDDNIRRIRHLLKNLIWKVGQLKAKHRMTCGEIEILREEVKLSCATRDRRRSWLETEGKKTKNVLLHLSKCLPYNETVLSLLLLEENFWLVNCLHDEAEDMLMTKCLGTFLIRYEPKEDTHVLSIRWGSKVAHCLIDYGRCVKEDCDHETHAVTGHGFAQMCPRFRSLIDFVQYFHRHSLSAHNEDLDTTLQFPVIWPKNCNRPEEGVWPIFGVLTLDDQPRSVAAPDGVAWPGTDTDPGPTLLL